jgi:hypothetical protein
MNPADGHEVDTGAARGALVIDGDELCWALNSRDPRESSHAFRIMEDFVDPCDDTRLARSLGQALQQRKPFRRFKDTPADHPTPCESWFAFERQAMEVMARRCCVDHGITPLGVTHRQPPSS